jgi:hypothetical protein
LACKQRPKFVKLTVHYFKAIPIENATVLQVHFYLGYQKQPWLIKADSKTTLLKTLVKTKITVLSLKIFQQSEKIFATYFRWLTNARFNKSS